MPRTWTFLLGCLLACRADEPAPQSAALPKCPDPDLLACSGLYGPGGETWATKQIAGDVSEYQPGLEFWSDGLDKRRWIRLPPGTRIDNSDPGGWTFPIGTAFWKEFSYQGRLIETRHMLKVTELAWYSMAYQWNADATEAKPVREGVLGVDGTVDDSYEIPTREDCFTCHDGSRDQVLGFEAISLSMPNATGLTLAELARRNLLTTPLEVPAIPGDAETRAALGYLHINCGVACHNDSPHALANWTGMHLRLEPGELGSPADTGLFRTAVGVASGFAVPGAGKTLRIAPGDAEHSAILYRAAQRAGPAQMPPLATHLIDAEGLQRLRSWVESLH